MVSFANSDYDFLIKCLNEGSPSYRAESIKRLTVLVSSDKKQFAFNVRKVLFGLEELLLEEKVHRCRYIVRDQPSRDDASPRDSPEHSQ